MDRKIYWKSGLFDEIELIYEKAEKDNIIADILQKLEDEALLEAKKSCCELSGILVEAVGAVLTPKQFDEMPNIDKETAICYLSGVGLEVVDQDIQDATIFIRFSPKIPKVMACTIFGLLNKLEKLDGTLNVMKPEWILELQVPLGGKKGLIQWEMLIMKLYPWLSVSEKSINVVADSITDDKMSDSVDNKVVESVVKNTNPNNCEKSSIDEFDDIKDLSNESKLKKSFWSKLFCRK